MEDDGSLFNIEISSSEDSSNKLPRDFQTEEEFNAVRREWQPKVEGSEIWKSLVPSITDNRTLKPDSRTILHAIEELYFFRRYQEALKAASKVLEEKIPDDLRKCLQGYQTKCTAKLDDCGGKLITDLEENHGEKFSCKP